MRLRLEDVDWRNANRAIHDPATGHGAPLLLQPHLDEAGRKQYMSPAMGMGPR